MTSTMTLVGENSTLSLTYLAVITAIDQETDLAPDEELLVVSRKFEHLGFAAGFLLPDGGEFSDVYAKRVRGELRTPGVRFLDISYTPKEVKSLLARGMDQVTRLSGRSPRD